MRGLSAAGCAARRAALIDEVGADLLIVSNPRHLFYLSGLHVTPLALSGWGPVFLLIDGESGDSHLLVHNFLAPAAEAAHVDRTIVYPWYDAASEAGVNLWRSALDALNQQLQQRSFGRAGIEVGSSPLGLAVEATVDITDTLWRMRRVKHADELALIRDAVRAVEAGHRTARQMIRPGVSELDVYNAINDSIVTEAGGPVVPLGDFAAGERAYQGGGPPTTRVLQAGDLMILDLFPIVNGYRADFTATVSVDGSLSKEQEALQEALHAAITAGEEKLEPGAGAADVYEAVRGALDEHGFAAGFGHHAGHGLGLGHPEAPHFVPQSEEQLQVGDVVTLEPGSYGKQHGARIEHNYLITEDGFERLTHHHTRFA